MFQLFSFLLIFFTNVYVHCDYISTKKSTECENFCNRIACETIKECKDGIIFKNESYCNCCDACIKYLDIDQPCNQIVKGSLALVAQSRCKPGTKCENRKCVLDPSVTYECLLQSNIRKKREGTGKYNKNIWIPQCDKDGNYAAKQMKMRKSICFDESGGKLFGTADDTVENACACSRYMQKMEKTNPMVYNTKPQEHCSPSGSFATLQCINDLCYCADKNTGRVTSHLVKQDFLDKLPCYDSNSHTKNYLTSCEIELQRSRKLAYEFWQKGVKVIGFDRINCDPDGTFSPKQCLPKQCVCTDKDGVGIGSYHPEFKDIEGINMMCNCAREEKYTMGKSMFRCVKHGNYESLTCVDNQCVCVDDDGDIISEQSSEELDTSTCEKLIQYLSEMVDDSTDDYDETTDEYIYPEDYNW